ncbi:MAG: type VII secretion protein EssC [Clostridium sp.]|nr:type VII secretion protein EssC [Clostridium sp.]
MIVNLIKNREMFSITLPERIKGQYWLNDIDENGDLRQIISIEGHKNDWVLKSNKNAWILDNGGNPVKNTLIKDDSFFNIKIKDENEKVILFSEPVSSNRYTFKKIVVKQNCSLTIGRSESNNIVFSNKYVSSNHCIMNYDGESWSIIDKGSTNGTFVNSYRVDSQTLIAGDYVYIMGLKIIVGSNYLAINNPGGKVELHTPVFANFKNQAINERDNISEPENEYFYRSPRFMRQIDTAHIKIDPPPAIQKPDEVPLALTLGPSMTMGIASLSTAVMTIINATGNDVDIKSVIPTLCMSLSMLLGTVMWPILTKKHDRKSKIEGERKRQEKYLRYLDSIRDEIKRNCKEQTDILNENIISVDECLQRISLVKRSLWERSIGQDDFLKLRLGKGTMPLDADIKYPEAKFTMEDDNLQDAMLSLGSEAKQLADVPISISLVSNYFTGIIGKENDILNLAKSLVIQMVSLHSYDELKIMLIIDEDDMKDWEFTKTIPHFWNDDKTQRFIAANNYEVKELSVIIEKEIVSRINGNKDADEYLPYYVIITTNKSLADRCENLNQLFEYKQNCGFSIISIREELKDLPKEVSSVIQVSGMQSKLFDRNDLSGKTLDLNPEFADSNAVDEASYVLSNVYLDISNQMYSLPNMITFLEMFNVGKIEHLNSLTRWKENNPVNTLQAPVGVDTQGEIFYLDLHEKYHGPHGLVAGMTGSGKSEFIITYILSLAVNYHPDEVAFILIDYKGGGLTGAFEDDERGIKLPHLAGTITNLDGSAIKRSLVSIQSELRRRQAIFNYARKISNEGTMDIYKYQRLYRDGIVTEPVPHLFIISDEFAELKTQQPEFMEQLISAARIGRSLGVHLILATQKPSGVVDDQIWSNSKFRVCLKVQEKADSQDMIKRPDAAELQQTGRFYLQVGFNEFFALGQSAWCGAEYIPTENVEKKVDDSVEIIDNLGRVIKEIKPDKVVVDKSPRIKQIVGIVKYLSDLAKEENVSERPLWLDPIPERIFVKDLEEKYNVEINDLVVNPVIGEYDDPFNQKQDVVTIPLSKEGNCLMYGAAGNGKTTFLSTLTYSLISTHSVDALNMYILDFGSETLRAFDKAPHVGNVIVSADEEKVINLFKMLSAELNSRKQLFADFGGDYASYCKSTGKVIPNIVVLINNYAGFSEQFENLEDTFGLLSRDGVKYGLTFVVTASTTNAVRYRYVQNFKQIMTMQLNDPTDYPVVIGRTDGLVPAKFKGRGLISLDKIYEFQTAYCNNCDDQYEFIREYCTKLNESATVFAKPIPVLPDFVKYEDVKSSIGSLTIPVGIEKRSINPSVIDLKSKYIYPIIANDAFILEPFVGEFVKVIDSLNNCKIDIFDCENWCVSNNVVEIDFNEAITEIFNDIVKRNNGYKAANMDAAFLNDFEERLIVIVGMDKLVNRLDDTGKDRLFAMLFKGQALYKVHFIVLDSQSYFSTVNYTDWYKTHIQGNDGIYIGDGFADQYLLKANKHSNSFYEEIGNDFGYLLNKGKATLVKFLTTEVEQ